MATVSAGGATRTHASRRVHVTGWVVFASVLLIIAGVMNLVNGFTALDHHTYFMTANGSTHLVYTNLTFWGWAFLIWGCLQVLAGVLAWGGSLTGNAIGVALTGVASILWFFMIFAAPWAALVGITLNLVVLFALTAGSHPDEF